MTKVSISRSSVVLGVALGLTVLCGSTAWADQFDNLVPYIPPGAQEPGVIRQTDNENVYYYMDSNGDYKLE